MHQLSDWLSSNGLMPQGFCYQWQPALIWLHAVSDTLIALADVSISVALIQLVRRRRDIPFSWMFVCFGVFLAACGATHAMDVWTLWFPSYWFSGGVKIIAVLASVPTAVFFVHLMPQAYSLPTPEKMRAANEVLIRQGAVLKKSEERFRQMAENIGEIFWMMNPDTKEAIYVSPAFEPICELPVDSLYANPTSYGELIHLQDRQRVLAGLEELGRTNRFDEEFRIVCPSGTVKWLRAIGFVARDSAGQVQHFVGTAQEITARKEMEAVLRASEDRYRDLVEHSTDLICTYDLCGRLLSVNELPAKLLGYSRDELLNKPMRDLLLPEARAQFDESLLTIQRDGFVKGLMVVLTKTGERRVWEYHNTLRTDGVSSPVVRGIAHDVTDQRRIQKALRLSEEKFSKAFHSSPVEIAITTLQEGRILDVNESFERSTGFPRDEALGHTSLELGLWAKPDERATVVEQVKRRGSVRNLELQFRNKSGETRVKLYSAEPIEVSGSPCLLAVCEDITLRKQMEEELRFSEEKFSKAFRCSPIIVAISTRREGRFLEVNEAFERHTGYAREETIGRTALELGLWSAPREREDLVDAVRRQGNAKNQEVNIRTKSGQVVVILVSVESIELDGEQCLLTVGQDITERKRTEEHLRRGEAYLAMAQSMAQLGVWSWNPCSGYMFGSQEFLRIFGLDPAKTKLTHDLFLQCIHPEDRSKYELEINAAVLERRNWEFDYRIVLTDCSVKYIQGTGRPVFGESGEILEFLATSVDITDRKHAEEELRRLSGQLLRLQDEERRRIARELHDSTGQNLVALATILSRLHTSLPSSGRRLHKLASQSQALADRCIREVRTLSYLLHPPMLDEAGLEDAIRHYAGGFAERTAIELELEISPLFKRMTPDVEVALFRVVQESLTNIQRHSGSFTAKIRLDRKPGIVSLEVSDEGHGTSGKALQEKGRLPFESGVGIPSMQERVKLIGGWLDIESGSSGTTVRATVPMDD